MAPCVCACVCLWCVAYASARASLYLTYQVSASSGGVEISLSNTKTDANDRADGSAPTQLSKAATPHVSRVPREAPTTSNSRDAPRRAASIAASSGITSSRHYSSMANRSCPSVLETPIALMLCWREARLSVTSL